MLGFRGVGVLASRQGQQRSLAWVLHGLDLHGSYVFIGRWVFVLHAVAASFASLQLICLCCLSGGPSSQRVLGPSYSFRPWQTWGEGGTMGGAGGILSDSGVGGGRRNVQGVQ